MRTVCSGWFDRQGERVHVGIRVLVAEDGTGGVDSHGICFDCRDAFMERIGAAVHRDLAKEMNK